MRTFLKFILLTYLLTGNTQAAITDRDKAELGVERNYVTNGGCESSTTGYSAFNTTFSSGIPTTITSGSTKLSVAVVTSNVLQGNASCQFNLTTASASEGHGIITDPITIKDADLAKNLAVYFDYNFVSGTTNVDVSGTSTQTIEVWVYNVGLGTWYQPAGYRSINTKGTASQLVSGKTPAISFQSDVSNSSSQNQYRIAWIIKNAPSGTFQMNFDNVTFGRQYRAYGPAITDWKSFTPTYSGLGTVTNTSAVFRIIGDSVEMKVGGVAGTVTGSTASVNLPNNLSAADSSKLPSGLNYVGQLLYGNVNGSLPNIANVVIASGANAVNFSYRDSSFGSFTALTGSQLIANGAPFEFRATVPIAGFSSSTQLSSDTDTRVIAVNNITRTNASAQNLVASTETIVDFNSKGSDSAASYDLSGDTFTAPVTGNYQFSGQLGVGTGASVPTDFYIRLRLNNTSGTILASAYSADLKASSLTPVSFSFQISLNAGQIVVLTARCQTNACSMYSEGNSDQFTTMNIARLSGPSVIAADNTVSARYITGAGAIVSNAAVIDFGTKVWDSTGSVTTGASWKFTAPISGIYLVQAQAFTTDSLAAGNYMQISLYRNGSFETAGTRIASQVTSISNLTSPLNTHIRLLAGEYINIVNESGGSRTLLNNSGYNYVNITRVGNY
jgi:hypothetical protein